MDREQAKRETTTYLQGGGTDAAPAEAATAGSVTQRIARNLADHAVRMLERNEIKTFDDLASNERLTGLAGKTFDGLPGTLRLALSQSVGRSFVEARLVDLLIYIRSAIPRHARGTDLRGLVESQVPVLAAYIEQAIANATTSVGSFVTTQWSSMLAAIRVEPVLPHVPALAIENSERPALSYDSSP